MIPSLYLLFRYELYAKSKYNNKYLPTFFCGKVRKYEPFVCSWHTRREIMWCILYIGQLCSTLVEPGKMVTNEKIKTIARISGTEYEYTKHYEQLLNLLPFNTILYGKSREILPKNFSLTNFQYTLDYFNLIFFRGLYTKMTYIPYE